MIALIIILIIVIAVIQVRFIESAFKNVKYDCNFSKHLVEPGEEFEITITITNQGRVFIPFIKIEWTLPSELMLKGLTVSKTAVPKAYIHHVSTLYLMPRSKYVKRVKASFLERGRYIFPGAYVRVGDFLALGDKVKKQEFKQQEVVVYPKSAGKDDIETFRGSIMGDISIRRFVAPDPIMIIGFREYTGLEPMKAISWNHSAKTGKFMVKQFDYTVEPVISIVLDVEGSGFSGDADKKELAFSYTRSLCELLEKRGIKYDFLTNATTADASGRWSYIPEGTGGRHFSVIMEGLGRASHIHVETLNTIIEKFVQKKNYDRLGQGLCLLITVKASALVDAAYIEKNNGGKVYVISMEELAYEAGILSETAV
ncbi:MAG: DUF58 domain-containing protein [Defluviitaleaceae bacterium]|nr:DUF58 domain-containing protein [Defluviitaleaceae bacterium]